MWVRVWDRETAPKSSKGQCFLPAYVGGGEGRGASPTTLQPALLQRVYGNSIDVFLLCSAPIQ